MDLVMTSHEDHGRTVIEIGGEVDICAAPVLRERFVDLIDAGDHHLVVDLQGVDLMDSSGLGVLVGALKRVRSQDGSLVLVCAEDRLLRTLRITGLDTVFTIYSTVDDALLYWVRDRAERPVQAAGTAPPSGGGQGDRSW
jgi:anti-sigma B factor antagonist